jgi:hypothetical protein
MDEVQIADSQDDESDGSDDAENDAQSTHDPESDARCQFESDYSWNEYSEATAPSCEWCRSQWLEGRDSLVCYVGYLGLQIEERKSVLFLDNTCGAVTCSECWDWAKDASDNYDRFPYKHAKQCAEAYARYDDVDEAAQFRLSVRTAVIVDGAPLEESALIAAARELFEELDQSEDE